MKRTTTIAYWLLPANPNFFAQMIDALSARFDAPGFTPHLTVFIAADKPRAPAEVLAQIGTVAIELPVLEVSFSEQFTKTLFIRFAKTTALRELSDAISKLIPEAKSGLTDPHLSLLYKHLPSETKRELAGSIQLPFRQVAFDSICAMRCASPTQSAADVRAWKLA